MARTVRIDFPDALGGSGSDVNTGDRGFNNLQTQSGPMRAMQRSPTSEGPGGSGVNEGIIWPRPLLPKQYLSSRLTPSTSHRRGYTTTPSEWCAWARTFMVRSSARVTFLATLLACPTAAAHPSDGCQQHRPRDLAPPWGSNPLYVWGRRTRPLWQEQEEPRPTRTANTFSSGISFKLVGS
jgi:hypothetical protein